jgi:uncharacterized membrane protein (UPF0127 family)
MKMHGLRNARNGALLATRVGCAKNPWERGIGLLLHASVKADEGLWIDHCAAIHTMGMRASIDVYFLDKSGRVLKISEMVAPNRLLLACRGAACVVELGAQDAEKRDIVVGDQLILE